MKLTIKTYQGPEFPIEIDESATIADLKQKITASQGYPINDLRLLLNARLLDDSRTLKSCNLYSIHKDPWMVLMVHKPRPQFPEFVPPELPEYNTTSSGQPPPPWNPTEAKLKEMFMQKAREKAEKEKAEREKEEKEKGEKNVQQEEGKPQQEEAQQQGDEK